jgi:MOSC domain-containing protein YiiM
MKLRVASVNVGQPKQIGMRDGAPLMSAIAKTPVISPTIAVRALGLDGDRQANPIAHGGVDKAVYAYPVDNWSWWENEKKLPCFPARFGENLTLEGADETQVSIGDRFSWGDAVLEISQPRAPCEKFKIYAEREFASAWMTVSGLCGWYFRVIREGDVSIDGMMELIFESGGPLVRETFLIAFDRRMDAGRRAEIASYPALADAWRVRLAPNEVQ